MQRIYAVACLVICLLLPSRLCSQEKHPWLSDSCTNSHIIIAFDASLPPAYQRVPNTYNFNEQISKALQYIGLHESRDYYSFVNFVMGNNSQDLNSFAQISRMGGRNIAWLSFKNYHEFFSHGDWNFIYLGFERVQGRPFSLLTGAKAYSLRALYGMNEKDTCYANKTYLLMVTDDQYNGNNDINTEFNQLGPGMSRFRNSFLEFCRQVGSKYQFNFKKEFIIDAFLPAPYKVTVFEVVPTSSFSLNSVVDYPAMLGLKRTKSGYRLKFAYNCTDKDYTIQKLQIRYTTKDGQSTVHNYYRNSDNVDIEMHDIPSDSVHVTMKAWLKYNDGVYGGVVESPLDENFKRLSYSTTLPLGNEDKIFGIIPLPTVLWWFFPDDLSKAVIVWDVIIVLLAVILIIVLAIKAFVSWTKYEPTDEQIRLKKI